MKDFSQKIDAILKPYGQWDSHTFTSFFPKFLDCMKRGYRSIEINASGLYPFLPEGLDTLRDYLIYELSLYENFFLKITNIHPRSWDTLLLESYQISEYTIYFSMPFYKKMYKTKNFYKL